MVAYFWEFPFRNEYYCTSGVQPSSTRSTSHLSIFSSFEEAEAFPIVFPYPGEDDGFSWHVHTLKIGWESRSLIIKVYTYHGESFSRKKDLDKASSEEKFHNLFHNGK